MHRIKRGSNAMPNMKAAMRAVRQRNVQVLGGTAWDHSALVRALEHLNACSVASAS
jgi:hypothetical protein